LVIDAGELPPNEPSTVIDTTLSTPLTVRGNMFSHKNNLVLISCSDQETIDIAGKFLLKYWDEIKNRGLVIGLNGELGAGKTMFAKGIGQFLKIPQLITSPTYTYIKDIRTIGITLRASFTTLTPGKLIKRKMLNS